MSNSKKCFTQSDFDKAIADLESLITELKAKYPEFTNKNIEANLQTTINEIKFRGVYRTRSGRYCARRGGSKARINIGVYSTPEEAARAYDLAVVKSQKSQECITNFAVDGVETRVLFPDIPIPEIKSHTIDSLITQDGNKFKGVSKRLSCNRYQSQYCFEGKIIWVGNYKTSEEAARAYDLKAVELRSKGCTTNFAVEGIHTKVLFPDYPATKRHESTVLTAKPVELIKEPIQLNMVTLDDATDDNQEETIYDRMRAFAAQNGIEIKTMQT